MDILTPPIVLLMMSVSAVGVGSLVVHRLDASKELLPAEHVLVAGLIGALILASLVWLVGSWNYSTTTMAVLLAGVFLLSIVSHWQRLPAVLSALPAVPAGWWRLVPIAITLILLAGFIGAYAPPSDHDTLRYHLTLPHRDLAWGKIAVYFGWSVYEFSPPLSGLLTRFIYALAGPTGAQQLHVVWELLAAGTAAVIARRLGIKPEFCWLAALFLLSQRVSINLASTASNEFVLAAYAGGSVIVAQHFISQRNIPSAALLGLVIGGLCSVKHHGMIFAICLALPVLIAAIRHRIPARPLAIIVMTTSVIIFPLLLQNWLITANPFFPVFNDLLDSNNVNLFGNILEISRVKTTYSNLFTLPWNLFVDQNQFDGLQFGIPILLLFIPFCIVSEFRSKLILMATVVALYMVFWVILMPQFIRFLVPLFPILCAAATCGAERVALSSVNNFTRKLVLVSIGLVLALGQMGFLTATSIRRLPPALGSVSAEVHLNAAPFRLYAQYEACKWVLTRLKDDESYLAALNSPSYFCPPERAITHLLPGDESRIYTNQPVAEIPPGWLARQLTACKVRYVIVARNLGADSEPHVFAKHRYDSLINRVQEHLKPIHISGELSTRPNNTTYNKNSLAFIYDAGDMAMALTQLAAAEPSKDALGFMSQQNADHCLLLKPYKKLPWPEYK